MTLIVSLLGLYIFFSLHLRWDRQAKHILDGEAVRHFSNELILNL